METVIQTILPPATAVLLMLVTMPVISKAALRFNLTDKPGARKLHHIPVPLTGGIGIVLNLLLCSLINTTIFLAFQQLVAILTASLFLFIIGVMDDKSDLRASHKLMLQLAVAMALSASGIRLYSFYGLFGVYELAVPLQYLISVLLITGVINAFNLMDGVDGLAGGIALIGLALMSVFSVLTRNFHLAVFYAAAAAAVVGFLRFNLHNNKVFMGDAGSLFLGTLIVGSALYLLKQSGSGSGLQSTFLSIFAGFFAIPVLDSLRVYLGRLKKGNSPFRADKSHLHHLFLIMGLSHKKISLIICGICLVMMALSYAIHMAGSYTLTITFSVLLFSGLGWLLNLNKKVSVWREKIMLLEKGI